jgi:hypothetical protein
LSILIAAIDAYVKINKACFQSKLKMGENEKNSRRLPHLPSRPGGAVQVIPSEQKGLNYQIGIVRGVVHLLSSTEKINSETTHILTHLGELLQKLP